MDRKFLYFINPISGTAVKKKSLLRKIIEERTIEQEIGFEILYTNEEANYDFLLSKIKTGLITDVIICGGDGTINKIAKVLAGTNIRIGIIPGGSGNGLAFSVNIPSDTNKALDIIFSGDHHKIDAFLINNEFSCMLCGIGFDAQVAHDFAKQTTRGLTTYIRQSIRNFIKAVTYNFTIEINDQVINTNAYFISIANSNQFGNNFTIAPKASVQDGLLDIVVVQKMNKAKLLWAIAKQLKFGEVDEKHIATNNEILYFQTNKISILNHHNAPLHIDGDPAITSEKFSISILPLVLNLICP